MYSQYGTILNHHIFTYHVKAMMKLLLQRQLDFQIHHYSLFSQSPYRGQLLKMNKEY